jgi:hypothetical protein
VNPVRARRAGLSRRLPQYPHLLADLLTRVPHRRQYLFRLAPEPAWLCRAAVNVRTSLLTIINLFRRQV